MIITVEGPAGYPIDEPQRIARAVVDALQSHADMRGAAIVNADEDHEEFAFAGQIVIVKSIVAKENNQTPPDSLLARDPLCLAMFAAWVNVTPDKVPPVMRAHTCEATAIAWQRVADAARAHIEAEIKFPGEA